MSANEKYSRLTLVSKRVYRSLLVLYPKEFRREYGADMVQLFRDQCRDELRTGGVVAWIALWFRTLVELVGSTRRERERSRLSKVPYKREPLLAVICSLLVCPGLGQMYNHQMGKGITLIMVSLFWWPAGPWISGAPGALGVSLVVVAATVQLWSGWDAYRTAKRTNAYLATD